jgi:hypothetical protein
MLIVVAASLGFIADYSHLSASPTIVEVLAQYGDELVPSGFAAALGAIILIAFLCFFVAALRPRRRRARIYDRLMIPLALASVLAACWIVAFRHGEIGLSVAIMVACVITGSFMFVLVTTVTPSENSRWLLVPFSLYASAMTIALLVSMLLWLEADNAFSTALGGPGNLAVALFVIAAAAGGFVALRYRDFVYPAVIAAAMGSIFLRGFEPLAWPALVVCAGMLIVAVLAAIALARLPGSNPTGRTSRRRADIVRRSEAEKSYPTEAGTSIMRV